MAIRYTLIILTILILISCNKLPNNYNIDSFNNSLKYTEDPIVFDNNFNGMTLLYCPVQHGFSFGSNHNIIGLYDPNNNLIDEVEIGSIPVKLISWTINEIKLEVIEKNNKVYIDNWLKDKKRIGSFKLSFIY